MGGDGTVSMEGWDGISSDVRPPVWLDVLPKA